MGNSHTKEQVCAVSNSDSSELKSRSFHKRTTFLLKHAFIEIVYVIKKHRRTLKCFKKYIVEDVALICKFLNRLYVSFYQHLRVDPLHTELTFDFFMNMSTA